jgi:phosphoserine phosphatase RsbU/P
VPSDRLLGVTPDAVRHSTRVTLPPGGLLCLYTDGLVERRPTREGEATDIVADNIARLGGALVDADDAEMCCIRALAEVVGDHVADDDMAVLVARLDPSAPTVEPSAESDVRP